MLMGVANLLVILLVPSFGVAAVQQWEVRSMHIVSDIRLRFARTRITSRIINPLANQHVDAVFHVTLPNSAFITDFRYFSSVENFKFVGDIHERSTANRYYHLTYGSSDTSKYIGSKDMNATDKFKVILYMRPTDKITLNLTYEEVLERSDGKYKHEIFINPEVPVDEMTIDVAVQEARDITKVQTILYDDITQKDMGNHITAKRPEPNSAYIRYTPTPNQLTRWANGTSGLLSVTYDLKRGLDGGDIMVSNGYFIHFFAPEYLDPLPKDVLFILDTSTSMFINKLDQVRVAMKNILNNLDPEDRFNIISFGSDVNFWRKDMAEAKQTTNIQLALDYLDGLEALGWTDIMQALTTGLSYMSNVSRSSEGALVIFLTDGRAISGETNPSAIENNVKIANSKGIPLFTLAFGKDADWKLMKRLAINNFGIARKIHDDESAAKQIEEFCEIIGSSLLHDVIFKYPENTSIIRKKFASYIKGAELRIAGEIKHHGDPTTFNVTVTSDRAGINTMPKLVNIKTLVRDLTPDIQFDLEGMTRRMWAHLTIKDLLKKMAGAAPGNQFQGLAREALQISYENKLLTPLTAVIVVLRHRYAKYRAEYREDKEDYIYLGEMPFDTQARRSYYGSNRGGGFGDPHFMIYMKGLQYPICFDVTGKDNQIYQLLRDPKLDLTINVRMRNGRKLNKNGKSRVYYMTELNVKFLDLHLHMTCNDLTFDGITYSWERDFNGSLSGARFFIKVINKKISRVSVVFENRLQIDVASHAHRSLTHPGDDFLNIEVGNEDILSPETDGLLGQFIHKNMRLKDITFKNGYLVGELETRTGLEKQHGRARIINRKDPIWNTVTSCWLIKRMGERLFDGPAEYYIVNSMTQTKNDLICV